MFQIEFILFRGKRESYNRHEFSLDGRAFDIFSRSLFLLYMELEVA